MAEVEIGIGKSARRGYHLAELALVPTRRTRDPEDVDLSWQLDAFRFDLPLIAAPLDGVVSPTTAIAIGQLGTLAVLNLEGLWTRFEDPESLLAELSGIDDEFVTPRLQEMYGEPVKPELIAKRIAEISASGAVACGAISPQRAALLAPLALEAEIDVLVIQGTVVSAEHVSKDEDPLNLKQFIRELDIPVIVGGCASHQAALHLMRTGAVAVLIGVGSGEAFPTTGVLGVGTPFATAIADAAGAHGRHLEETGVYVEVIADLGDACAAEITLALACGADAVMIGSPLAAAHEAPGRGAFWAVSAAHPSLPRGGRSHTPTTGSLEEILLGPAHDDSGRSNLAGALRRTMALCGYTTIREFHKAEVMVGEHGPRRASPPGHAS